MNKKRHSHAVRGTMPLKTLKGVILERVKRLHGHPPIHPMDWKTDLFLKVVLRGRKRI